MTIKIESEDITIQEVVDLIIYMQNLGIRYTLEIQTRNEEEH